MPKPVQVPLACFSGPPSYGLVSGPGNRTLFVMLNASARNCKRTLSRIGKIRVLN